MNKATTLYALQMGAFTAFLCFCATIGVYFGLKAIKFASPFLN